MTLRLRLEPLSARPERRCASPAQTNAPGQNIYKSDLIYHLWVFTLETVTALGAPGWPRPHATGTSSWQHVSLVNHPQRALQEPTREPYEARPEH